LQGQRVITGTVYSADDGLTVPSATIQEVGANHGTISDLEGDFSLEVSDSAKQIRVTFIGMRSELISLQDKLHFEVMLSPEILDLEEVVISVPYSNQKKGSFTGSVGIIRSSQLEQNQAQSIDKLMQGNVAGVVSASSSGQPGAASEIRIRGIGSINASSEPLYVIDGVPVVSSSQSSLTPSSSVLASINPSDIESITVLKDAAASSLYGSRASNGVIMITTKKGKSGKTAYNFTTSHSFSRMANSGFQMMNAEEYTSWLVASMQNAGYSDSDIDAVAGSSETNTDWFSEVFRPAYSQNYQLSASGGSEKTSFFASLGYQDENGIVINTNYKEYAARLNIDHQENDRLKISLKLSPTFAEQNSTPSSAENANPVTGAYLLKPTDAVKDSSGYNFENNIYNVVGISELDVNENSSFRLLGNASLQYDFTDKLSFKTVFGNDYYRLDEFKYQHPETPDGALVNGRGIVAGVSRLDLTTSNTLSYKDSLGKGELSALIGYELQNSNSEFIQMVASNYADSKVQSLNAAANPESANQPPKKDWTILSYISSLQYNLLGRYYFSASFRRDGSSRFTNNKFGNFWSVGFSWRVSDEAFLQNADFLNSLKLRASYGTSGNSEVDEYASRFLYGYGYNYNSKPGTAPEQMGNEDLTWEKNNNADLGIDCRLFDRIQASAEVYYRQTWDLLLAVPVSAANGFDFQMQNVGEMENYGLEFTLGMDLLKKRSFSWQADANFMTNQNKVTKLYKGQDIVKGAKIVREGESFNSFYLVEWAGVNPADGSPLWINGEGNFTDNYEDAADSRKIIAGNADPDFIISFNNSFKYKRLSCLVSMYLNYGNDIYNNTAEAIISDGTFKYNQSKDALNYWRSEGDKTDVPRPVYNNTSNSNETSSRFLEDASFLRLKEVSLTYTLSPKKCESLQISSAQIFAKGTNLWTFTNYSGLDPEQNIRGVDFFSYPNARSFIVGLNVGF